MSAKKCERKFLKFPARDATPFTLTKKPLIAKPTCCSTPPGISDSDFLITVSSYFGISSSYFKRFNSMQGASA